MNNKYLQFIARYIFFIGLVILLASFAPYYILGEDSFITIHDHLDLSAAHIRMLMDHNAMFDYSQKLPIGEGISRSFFFVPFDLRLVFYYLFPFAWAIIANNIFARVIGYVGMFLLLDKYVLKDNRITSQLIKVALSVGFSLSCAYTDYSLSALGFPLIFYAFLNFTNKKHLTISYLFLILYCFYNHFELGGFFACCVIGMYVIYLWVKERELPWRVILPLAVMSLLFILQYLPMITNFFSNEGELSNRIEMHSTYSVRDSVVETILLMAKSMYHVGSIFAVPTICVLLYISIASKDGNRKKALLYLSAYGFIAMVFFLVRMLHNIPVFSIVQSFQFDRFYWMYPTLVCASCAFCCYWLVCRGRIMMVGSIMLLVVTSASNLALNGELRVNYNMAPGLAKQSPSFKAFFSEDMFKQIKSDCGISEWNTKVVSIGMFPSVVQFNRISTLDFYQSNYPLEYKHKFRKVIAKELEKDSLLQNYFDNWGNRCYIFSSELGKNYLYGKNNEIREVNNLEINTNALKDLGCSYIISAVRINNAKQLDLEYVNMYTTPESFWELYVYRL